MYVDNPCSVSVDSFVYFGGTSKVDSDSAEHRGDTDVIKLNV